MLAGRPRLQLQLASDQPDADLWISLYEVLPDGSATSLSQSSIRLRYRKAGVGSLPMVPGKPERIEVPALKFFARSIARGSRLRLVIDAGPQVDWQRNGQFLKENGYSTTLLGDEAVRIIDADDGSKPLFLYVAFLAPHAPYQAPASFVDRYKSIADEKRRTYAAMVTALDDRVGRIVGALGKKRHARQHCDRVREFRHWCQAPASNGDLRDGEVRCTRWGSCCRDRQLAGRTQAGRQ